MDTYATLNDALVKLFRDVMDLEEQAIITQEFQDITNNDVHVIQAIGTGEPKNMSMIAKELSVTVGTLTIAMNSLVKKGYVTRERGKEDRRVVYKLYAFLAAEKCQTFIKKSFEFIKAG